MTKGIKTIKEILLTDVDINPETLTRQSLVALLKGRPETWQAKIKKANKTQYEYLTELMNSMKSIGLINPIGVRQIDVPEELLKEDGREGIYFMIFGLRRFLAAYFLGWKKIKAAILNE